MAAMARLAEEAGFDSVWVPDHLLYRFPGPATHGAWEGWSLLAALAAVTTRVALGTVVMCAGWRNPALLAKMADSVDEISGGRLILRVGAGWHEPEFRAFGFPYDYRASRFEEALTIIAGLLRQGRVDFVGRFYQARECELRPRGPRPQGPPLMIGTIGARMLRLTAQYADAWNAWMDDYGNRAEGIAPLRAAVDAACAEVGRDPATLARTAGVLVEAAPQVTTEWWGRWGVTPLTGPPEALAEQFRAFGREGLSHLQVTLLPNTPAGIAAFAPVLERLDRASIAG
jgi:alkanesulfonate monooxygenase SsuD/methylene tetrahydromethanopterin reductase-like flavin-dependent oxidoreductase (luciferase family)